MRSPLVLALLLASSTAIAAPAVLSHQGRLFDDTGAALTGTHTVAFGLYEDSSGTTLAWEEQQSVEFSNGYFTVLLGENSVLEPSLFHDTDDLWLFLAVDSGTNLPGGKVASVPWALSTDTATNVSGGTVDATEVLIDGTTIIDGTGAIDATSVSVGGTTVIDSAGVVNTTEVRINGTTVIDSGGTVVAPSSGTTLDGLGCTDDQVAKMVSGAWACAADDRVYTPDEIGALATTGGTLTGDLTGTNVHLSGLAQVGDSGDGCTSALAGALRYRDGLMWYCHDDSWWPLAVGDITADPFSFASQTDVAQDTDIVSNTITPAGFDVPIEASVSGDASATLIIDGVDSGAQTATITPGQTLSVGVRSATTGVTATTVTVDLGGETADFTITTVSDCVSGNQTFTASTSWTVPTGCTELTVVLVGGGGGGWVGGGGGGAYASGDFTVTPGATLGIEVGAAGATTYSSATQSESGGDSAIAELGIVAGGGAGAYPCSGNSCAGGAGGTPSGHDVGYSGGSGGTGTTNCSNPQAGQGGSTATATANGANGYAGSGCGNTPATAASGYPATEGRGGGGYGGAGQWSPGSTDGWVELTWTY